MKYEISITGGETKTIHLSKCSKEELLNMLEITIDVENYEMCSVFKKYLDRYEKSL